MEELEELKEDGELFEDMAVTLNDTKPHYSSLKRKSVMIHKESNEHIYATIEEIDIKD